MANNSANSYDFKCVTLIEANSLRPRNHQNPSFTLQIICPNSCLTACPATHWTNLDLLWWTRWTV